MTQWIESPVVRVCQVERSKHERPIHCVRGNLPFQTQIEWFDHERGIRRPFNSCSDEVSGFPTRPAPSVGRCPPGRPTYCRRMCSLAPRIRRRHGTTYSRDTTTDGWHNDWTPSSGTSSVVWTFNKTPLRWPYYWPYSSGRSRMSILSRTWTFDPETEFFWGSCPLVTNMVRDRGIVQSSVGSRSVYRRK